MLNIAGVTNGGSVGSNLDTLTDAVAGIEADGGMATNIIASPDAWAALSKLKAASGSSETLLGAGVAAGERSLLGVPVQVSPSMPADSLLIVDRSAVLAAQSPIRVARSEDAFFSSDVIGVRVTWRLGWSVMHAARVARLSTAPAA